MCLSKPKMPTQTPVAPIAPISTPTPMGMADAGASSASARKGINQLRIATKGADAGKGEGPAAPAEALGAASEMTIKGRKELLDKKLAAAGN